MADTQTMAERILGLTLEIIQLLDGEDYISGRISKAFISQNPRNASPPIKQAPPLRYEKILEVAHKIIELLSAEQLEVPEQCLVTVKEEMKEEAAWTEEWACTEESKDPPPSPDDGHGEDPSELRIIISGDCDANNDHVTSNSSLDDSTTTSLHDDHKPEDGPYGHYPVTPNLHPEPSHESLHRGWFPEPPAAYRAGSDVDPQTQHRPFACPECGKRFTLKSVMTKHLRRHTEEKPHSCPECGKCFVVKHDLTRHRRRHTGEKPYLCPVCWKGFFSKGELTRHQTTHSKEKPFSCPQCEGSFTRREHLVLHLRSHTGEKPYSCPECGKCFSYKSNLITHERTHRGEKPYLCPECGKSFSSKFNLLLHQRAHRGEKPYSCSECGKCFTKTTNLLSHLQTHAGAKPFSCSECGKCFSRNMDLVRHKRTHAGEKPCSCSRCVVCVARREALTAYKGGYSGSGSHVLPKMPEELVNLAQMSKEIDTSRNVWMEGR